MSSVILAAAVARHARHLPASLVCRALGSTVPQAAASGASITTLSKSHNTRNSTSLLKLAAASSLVAAYSISDDNKIAFCESTTGPADVMEDSDDIVVVEDGMDAGVIDASSPESPTDAGPADVEEDDEDDPSNDEETSCSICLINRQGPCRKYWLKFERCMKEHSAEKEKATAEAESKTAEEAQSEEESKDDAILTEQEQIEREWDAFMEKSIQPGEDDDDGECMCILCFAFECITIFSFSFVISLLDDDDEEDEDEGDDDEDDSSEEVIPEKEEMTLAERCDKFMM